MSKGLTLYELTQEFTALDSLIEECGGDISDPEVEKVWDELMALQPQAFSLVAQDYATSALACDGAAQALARLEALYKQAPSVDLLSALNRLQNDPALRRQRLLNHRSAGNNRRVIALP